MSFENKLNELKEITEKLEDKVSLDEGIDLFQKSLTITKECLNELNECKSKITTIKSEMDKILEDNIEE